MNPPASSPSSKLLHIPAHEPPLPARAVSQRPRFPQRTWLREHGLLAALLIAAPIVVAWWSHVREGTAAAQESSVTPGAALEARSEEGASQSLPLVSESIVVRIDDGFASSVHQHAFQNESKARLEGTYKLIVGEGATATGFSYWNGAERIVGEVFEREAARQVYEAVTGMRKDPGLLEQTDRARNESDKVTTLTVGSPQ